VLRVFHCTDSGHFTIRDVVYDGYTDEETSDVTPVKRNRNLSTRHSKSPARGNVVSQVASRDARIV